VLKADGGPQAAVESAIDLNQAAFSHMAVSNALLISGMLVPKLLAADVLAAGFTGLSATLWVVSTARSHDPCSWERATEKNRST
jgi:hypothetical protein